MTRVDLAIDPKARLRQSLAEHDLVEHVKQALRLALSWNVEVVGVSRKLMSVKFCGESLGRHLDLLMEMEEQGGYLDDVAECKPNLYQQAVALCNEHGQIRTVVQRVLNDVQAFNSEDEAAFNALCGEVERLLQKLDAHEERERDMIFELYCADEGGEGGGGG